MKVLRWIAVLPGAIVAVIAANFLLHWVVLTTFRSETVHANTGMIERVLLPFVAAIAFVAAGAQIAPSHRIAVATALAVILGAAWAVYFFF